VSSSQLATTLPTNQDGALEGELVAVLPPGSHAGCPSDASHVHLQVLVGNDRYDVAIDTGQADGAMDIYETTLPASSSPAGWSTAGFDYVTTLGVHASSFTQNSPAAVAQQVQDALANVSTLSIHGLSYTDGTGLHDVHYNGHGHDGVLLLHGQGDGCGDKVVALHFVSNNF
jgi:hypothetical protein